MVKTINILADIESYITVFFEEKIAKEYVFHDLNHTINVVKASLEIGQSIGVSEDELEILQVAAWFHDTGYTEGPKGHEQRSVDFAKEFLQKKDYPEQKILLVEKCILATFFPHNPEDLLEKVLCDADLSHLGKKNYWDRCGKIRLEMNYTQGKILSDQEWVDFEIDFLEQHEYFTSVAREMFAKRKKKHLRQLIKQKIRLNPGTTSISIEEARLLSSKKKNIPKDVIIENQEDLQVKDLRLGRGVETMYRAAYRTHVNLSSIADNKANIMLSVNAIIISITLSTFIPNIDSNPKLVLPIGALLLVCLGSIIFATLATRPKITSGIVTKEDIIKKRSNLLFFGNFYQMKLEDFHWGMMEMIKDQDFLYATMTRDLYFLGKVLAKKYRYLSICYGIFMYGIIAVVTLFGINYFML